MGIEVGLKMVHEGIVKSRVWLFRIMQLLCLY